MTNQTVLFVSHRDKNCGVYQFGRNVAQALSSSKTFDYQYVECSSHTDLQAAVAQFSPCAVIYNHHASTAPWLTIAATRQIRVPQLGILHEVTQRRADTAVAALFDYIIAPDPTLLLRNPRVFKTGRFIPYFENSRPAPTRPTFGSFGFATSGKSFSALVRQVQREFDDAEVRLHIPFARFGDATGERARKCAEDCRAAVTKPRIQLTITHDFLEPEDLLSFLAGNSLNAFMYDDTPGRGIASTTDYALAVDRPIAISNSSMFRHLRNARPSIVVGDVSLRQILQNGITPLRPYRHEWTQENLRWEYDRIISTVLAREASPRAVVFNSNDNVRAILAYARAIVPLAIQVGERALGPIAPLIPDTRLNQLGRLEGAVLRRLGNFGTDSSAAGDWVPSSSSHEHTKRHANLPLYQPTNEPTILNRILDDNARTLYAPAIAYMRKAAPEVMSRKIERANVQQGFMLDTVVRLAGSPGSKRILAVGSYEDSAALALSAGGYEFDEVDPMLNYDLATYMTKPSTKIEGYDIIFATSVIEHIANDEEFVSDMARLLRPNGTVILTCDFRNDFRPGDRMPGTDRRLYTVKDLGERLLASMPGCRLVDPPQWSNAQPDFEYEGTMYSFATFVVQKQAH